jgi:hypothetical protein
MKPEGGRFDEDTYARARKWREEQDKKAAEPAKAPSKRRVAPVAASAKAPDAPAAKGSGRGAAGPTADELSAYDKQQKDKRFEESIRANLSTSENDAANKYRDRAVAAAVGAASPLGGLMRMGALRAAPAPLKALKEMTSGGPKVASKVTPSRPVAKTGRKTGVSDETRKSGEGFNPAEANRMLARNKAKADAAPKPKPKAAPSPRKPKASVAPARDPKSSVTARKRTRYNEDEAGVEFKSGGKIKSRGYGCASKG